MLKPFDHLAALFSEVADDLKNCRDPEARKELLVQMRLIVDEADSLLKAYHRADSPDQPEGER